MTTPTITREKAIDAIQLAILDLSGALGAILADEQPDIITQHIDDARRHVDTAAATASTI